MTEQQAPKPPGGLKPELLGGVLLNELTGPDADAEWNHVVGAAQRINERLYKDSKTDLLNEAAFVEGLGKTIDSLQDGDELAVVILDADGFKTVNDALGHAGGDELLGLMGPVVRGGYVRNTGIAEVPGINKEENPENVARLGGDEFAVSMIRRAGEPLQASSDDRRTLTFEEGVQIHTEQLNAALKAAIKGTKFEGFDLKFSSGLAMYQPGDTKESLITRADLAMLEQKTGGKKEAAGKEEPQAVINAVALFNRIGVRVPDWLKEEADELAKA